MKFIIDQQVGRWGGQGGWCLQANQWFSPPASMTSCLASVTFKMVKKGFIEETDKNFEFIRQYCSDFLDLEILRSLLSQKNRLWYFFWNETSSGVMNFKISFYRLANFAGNHTDRSHFWGPVHSKMKECWHSKRRFIKRYIILYIVRIFSSLELVEPHINPFKVRLQ